MLDLLKDAGYETLSVGKIYDIFAGKSVSELNRIKNNHEGMLKTIEIADRDFNGICFVNLVDFDMVYGHRNDVPGYAKAMTEFDRDLSVLLPKMRDDDLLIITADHGCDPTYTGTDHTREYVPILCWSRSVNQPVDLGTRSTYADMAATIADYFGLPERFDATSFWPELKGE